MERLSRKNLQKKIKKKERERLMETLKWSHFRRKKIRYQKHKKESLNN